jgi:hypothetical protein
MPEIGVHVAGARKPVVDERTSRELWRNEAMTEAIVDVFTSTMHRVARQAQAVLVNSTVSLDDDWLVVNIAIPLEGRHAYASVQALKVFDAIEELKEMADPSAT